MKEQNTSTIDVNLSGPQKKGGHYVYSIVGKDKNGQFNTVRRYSDFNNLRNTILAKWPGCYIPSLPEKKIIGNQDSTFIQIRKNGLQYFITSLKYLQHLWYSQEVQLFLRKIGDTQKELQKMKQINLTQILQRYKIMFPQSFNKQISKDLNSQMINFSQYLKKSKGLLQNLLKMVEQIFNARKKCNDKYLSLIQNTLPDYETNCMSVYMNENNMQDLAFTGLKQSKILPFYQQFRKKNNPALFVLEQIKRQRQEILAFEQVLKTKQYFSTQKQKVISKVKDLQIQTTKIHAGKQSLMSKIKNLSKDQQLKINQANIQKAQQEQKNLALLCEVISVMLGSSQIQKFKSFRQRQYFLLLKKSFQLQKQQCQLKKDFYNLLIKQNHQKQEIDNFFQSDKSPIKDQVSKQNSTSKTDLSQIQNQQFNNKPQDQTIQKQAEFQQISIQKVEDQEQKQEPEQQKAQEKRQQNLEDHDIE